MVDFSLIVRKFIYLRGFNFLNIKKRYERKNE